jgi:hypothetical protein
MAIPELASAGSPLKAIPSRVTSRKAMRRGTSKYWPALLAASTGVDTVTLRLLSRFFPEKNPKGT